MTEQLESLLLRLADGLAQLFQALTSPVVAKPLLLVIVIAALATLLTWPLVKKWGIHWLRAMHARPKHLKALRYLLRNLGVIIFAILLTGIIGLGYVIGSELMMSNTLLLTLECALAWLFSSFLSQHIKNKGRRKLLAFIAWVVILFMLFGLSDEATAVLDSAAFVVGGKRLSLLLFVKIVLVGVFAIWLATWFGNFIDGQLKNNKSIDPGLQVLISKVLKIVLLTLALVTAISSIGIDLTIFSVFSGAVGVGVGFGLQKVVSNYISGLIILADRSIKPGDTITLGDTFGSIRELRARFVSVITRDGREYLIPNEDFITKEMINWSFSDDLVRLDVNFGVSYDSDPHEVIELAIAACKDVPRVLRGKTPVCWLTEFGDSSLNFVLRFWIRDPRGGLTNIRGQVMLSLWDAFKVNDINIPYPHRELIFKAPKPESADTDAPDENPDDILPVENDKNS